MLTQQRLRFISLALLILNGVVVSSSAAEVVEYDLTIDYKTVNYTGRDVKAMAINDAIPGPTVRFQEGDVATQGGRNDPDRGVPRASL